MKFCWTSHTPHSELPMPTNRRNSYRCRRHDVYSRLWISAVETNVLTCSVFERYTIINSRCGLRTSELKTQYPSMFQMQTKPTLSALNSRVFALFVSSAVTIASATFVCNTKIAFAANRIDIQLQNNIGKLRYGLSAVKWNHSKTATYAHPLSSLPPALRPWPFEPHQNAPS